MQVPGLLFKGLGQGFLQVHVLHGGAQVLPVELGPDRLGQFLGAQGFGEVVVGTQKHALTHVAPLLQRGQQDQGCLAESGVFAQVLQQVKTTHARHVDVADDQVGLVFLDQVPGGETIAGFEHFVALVFQHHADEFECSAIVFRYHYQGHRCAVSGYTWNRAS
ncbi:MAG: hypothetical protein A3B67_05150 [Burkholderiales bacterium RIFCSPHIGHO2_02_FULL_66_10]|nr:MAG: hypothetical protein A3B67_05150 [Burkholderiales bacterium RIFCSPHIGHO2_02_FULL_66_10]